MSVQQTRNIVVSSSPKGSQNNPQNSGESISRDVAANFVLLAKTDNARIISQILNTLHTKKEQV